MPMPENTTRTPDHNATNITSGLIFSAISILLALSSLAVGFDLSILEQFSEIPGIESLSGTERAIYGSILGASSLIAVMGAGDQFGKTDQNAKAETLDTLNQVVELEQEIKKDTQKWRYNDSVTRERTGMSRASH